MTSWKKEEIEIADGTKVLAQMPVIVSASRSTDIPAFYSDWFMERLGAGYVKWFNPFNGVPLYVGFKKMRCVVFWSKNPRPMLAHLDALDAICPHFCHYCYANANNATALANWKRHCTCPHAETITGK